MKFVDKQAFRIQPYEFFSVRLSFPSERIKKYRVVSFKNKKVPSRRIRFTKEDRSYRYHAPESQRPKKRERGLRKTEFIYVRFRKPGPVTFKPVK